MKTQPALFISHGGGPWPWVPEMKTQFHRLASWLESLPAWLPEKPRAVLSISGHWEEDEFTVSTAMQPPMIFDYSGFPAHTYQLKYAAPGSTALAKRVQELASASGIAMGTDVNHGFDHGTFVPLALMYPQADVPVVSLSLKSDLDPADHLNLGEALAPLRREGILILGSGLSYHNLGLFGPRGTEPSREFEAWLTRAVESDSLERNQALRQWESAPSARAAHPREDHLLPLMVVAGAAGLDRGQRLFVDDVWGIRMSSYAFPHVPGEN